MGQRLLAIVAAVCAACVACVPADPPPPAADPSVAEQVRRLAAILDYVSADYPAAIRDGVVVNPLEYEEQLAFLADAESLAASLPVLAPVAGAWREDLAGVRAGVKRIESPHEVSSLARRARRDLLSAYGVVLAPTTAPSLAAGHDLYAQNCANCHGTSGRGDGAAAAALKPRPRSFLDLEVMRDLSPARAFSAVTDGIEGTAMPSFAILPASDRWSLAFYVFTLRHDGAAVERGEAVYLARGRGIAATPTRLAGVSDGELEQQLTASGVDPREGADAVAFLRSAGPYGAVSAPFDLARERLDAALAAFRGGDPDRAKRESSSAYLDGFEPHEAALRAVDAAIVPRVEQAFLDLRRGIEDRAPLADVEARALQIGTLLDAAEERLSGGTMARIAFFGAFAVILREGLEGALLVLLILAWARRAGAEPADVRMVHGGWVAAVGLGAITWFVSGSLIARFGGTRRELVEGVVALTAAAVLLLASHFVLARLDAKRRVQALKRRLDQAVSTPRRRLVLAGMAFLTVYREAFEVVLFLRALMFDAASSPALIAAGVLFATVLLIVLVFLLGRIGRRLRPAALLSASGTLLCILAIVLAGKGVRSLQEAGYVGVDRLALPRLDGLGLYPTTATIAAQAVVFAAFLTIALWALVRARIRS